jgi:hypothetical protein
LIPGLDDAVLPGHWPCDLGIESLYLRAFEDTSLPRLAFDRDKGRPILALWLAGRGRVSSMAWLAPWPPSSRHFPQRATPSGTFRQTRWPSSRDVESDRADIVIQTIAPEPAPKIRAVE